LAALLVVLTLALLLHFVFKGVFLRAMVGAGDRTLICGVGSWLEGCLAGVGWECFERG
jgi:hypothetical protein